MQTTIMGAALLLAIATPKLKSDYAGTLKVLDGLAFAGDVRLDVTSVRELAAWAGSPMPAGDGFGALALSGKASGSEKCSGKTNSGRGSCVSP